MWSCYEPDNVLEGKPAHEHGLGHLEEILLLCNINISLNRKSNVVSFLSVMRQFCVLHWEEIITLCRLFVHRVCNCYTRTKKTESTKHPVYNERVEQKHIFQDLTVREKALLRTKNLMMLSKFNDIYNDVKMLV